MKLLLTSVGLVNKKLGDFFVSILPKKPEDCSVLMIACDQTPEDFKYTKEAQEELRVLGIRLMDFFNLRDGKYDNVKIFDVIYVCGGNTFLILDRMKKTGVFDFVSDAVKNKETIYVGISAGSIIAGKSIKSAGWGSQGDKNEIGLTDFSGLGFTNIAIYPHFYPELKKEIDEFRKKVDYPVIEIADYQAVYIQESGYEII
jgi:peptidase E